MQNHIRRGNRARALFGLASAGLLLVTLTGCAGEVPLQPAEDANNPACAEVMVRLPDEVAGQKERYTNAQATSAWGNPASILLYCGIQPTGPTDLPCVTLNGVDWIRDDSRAPLYRFEAYGRSPGLEVIIDDNAEPPVSGTTALMDLSNAVAELPQTRKCTTVEELNIDDAQ